MTNPESPSPSAATYPWIDMAPSPTAKRETPVKIREQMLVILKKQVEDGALSNEFNHLDWIDGFRKDKLAEAMRLLANATGLTLQFQSKQSTAVEAFRWRLKP